MTSAFDWWWSDVATMLESALEYAASGWAVFPCEVGGKRPATSHGFKDATRDPRIINTWWGGFDYNIGLDIPEDIAILDFDPRNGAPKVQEVTKVPTRTATTPQGGTHLYFSVPREVVLKGKLMDGVDVKRGGKGYVLLPPSVLANGGQYWWARDMGAVPLPERLLQQLAITTPALEDLPEGSYGVARYFPWERGSRYGLGVLRHRLEDLDEAENGERNNALYKATVCVAQFIAGGELREDTLEDLKELALLKGLERYEVFATMKSAWDAGVRQPRRKP